MADTTPASQTQPGGETPDGVSTGGEQQPGQQRGSRPLWQTILAIVVLALLVGGAAYAAYALLGGAQVPDVVDMSLFSAQLRIEEEGLEIGEIVGLSSAASTHAVVAQSPDAGADVRRGSLVDLEVVPDTDWVKPPGVVGMQAIDAESTIRDYDLVPMPIQAFAKDSSVGVVVAQLPEENVPMRPDAILAYVVALGGRTGGIEVPLVVGTSAEEAAADLEALGFRPEILLSERAYGRPGVVVEQLPLPGWFAADGSPVALLVPTGSQ